MEEIYVERRIVRVAINFYSVTWISTIWNFLIIRIFNKFLKESMSANLKKIILWILGKKTPLYFVYEKKKGANSPCKPRDFQDITSVIDYISTYKDTFLAWLYGHPK